MARPNTALPVTNDLTLEGRVLLGTDWRWQNTVAYQTNDITVFTADGNDLIYIALQPADDSVDATDQSPANAAYWRPLSSSSGGGSGTPGRDGQSIGVYYADTADATASPQVTGISTTPGPNSMFVQFVPFTGTAPTTSEIPQRASFWSRYVGPQGPQGEQGPAGMQGPRGPAGPAGMDAASVVANPPGTGGTPLTRIEIAGTNYTIQGGGTGTDTRTPMEIIRSAIFDSYTNHTITFENGFPSREVFTLANGQVINKASEYSSDGFPVRDTYSGSYIAEVSGVARQILVHSYNFMDGFPTSDPWEFITLFDIRIASDGLIVETTDTSETTHLTGDGLIVEDNQDLITITEDGLIVESR